MIVILTLMLLTFLAVLGALSQKVTLAFLTYDFWVGFFWDGNKRIMYFCPLPCVVLKFELRPL